jgi:hypothetical protein
VIFIKVLLIKKSPLTGTFLFLTENQTLKY